MSEAADRAASLAPGRGHLDLFGYADLERAGAGLDLAHSFTPNVAAFARGWAGKERDRFEDGDRWRTDVGALAGARFHW